MDLVFSRTKKIPNKSFGRECSLCSSRHGVPIECSARGCKATYHTTCAIRGKLKMQAIFGKSFKGGIKLRSYCREHTPSASLDAGSATQDDKIDASGLKEIDMTNLADDRLQEDHEELDYFWKYVDINEVHKKISDAYARINEIRLGKLTDDARESTPKKNKKLNNIKTEATEKKTHSPKKSKVKQEISQHSNITSTVSVSHEIDPLALDLIYRYWMLLRTANNGQSLIKFSPSALKEREFEQRKSIMKLRIELERVRNLSYMIGKREKLKSSWLKSHQNIIKRTFNIIDELKPVTETQSMIESSDSSDNQKTSNHSNQLTSNYHHYSSSGTPTNGKKSLHQTQHIQPTNGMFDESDQLINDLITCDQIYELPNSSMNSNYSNLSHQDRSTLERRRTLSLVRRINRQLKSIRTAPTFNPYAKNYLALKRSDSPMGGTQHNHQSTAKILKYG